MGECVGIVVAVVVVVVVKRWEALPLGTNARL
jgi:hypothetical protein